MRIWLPVAALQHALWPRWQKVNAEVVLITTSDLDISLLIHQEDEDVALNALNKAFEL